MRSVGSCNVAFVTLGLVPGLLTFIYQTLIGLSRQFRSDRFDHIRDIGQRSTIGRAGAIAILGADRAGFGHCIEPHQKAFLGKFAAVGAEAADRHSLLLIGDKNP